LPGDIYETARRLAGRARLLLVYGPTGTGKTSLLEALAEELAGGEGLVYVDGALAGVRAAPDPEPLQALIDAGAPPLDLYAEAEAQGAKYTIIDHVEHLPRYRIPPADSRLSLLASDLHAASTVLARKLRPARLLIATTEASVGSLLVRRRLAGGPGTFLYKPGLDWEEARDLYTRLSRECGVDPRLLHELTRGAPGLARAACEKGVREWLLESALTADAALAAAAPQLERTIGWKPSPLGLITVLSRLEEEEFNPLQRPQHYMVAEALAPYNTAYLRPVLSRVRVELHPPIHALAKHAAETGAETLAGAAETYPL